MTRKVVYLTIIETRLQLSGGFVWNYDIFNADDDYYGCYPTNAILYYSFAKLLVF